MTWTLVWMSMTLAAGTADNAKEAMAAEELKEADEKMEEALPAEAKDLEEDMKKAKMRLKKKEAAKEAASGTGEEPGEETGDWAEDKRWERYNERAKKHGHKHRQRRDPNAPAGVDPDGAWVGEPRPEFMVPRRPLLGLALGGLVGFGTGYFYAGEVRKGVIFAVLDAIFVVSFVAATVELNRLVVEHDFRSGLSLANGDREFGKREANLYATSLVMALAGAGSHIFQAVGGFRATKRTNETIHAFSFVPTGNGAMLHVTW